MIKKIKKMDSVKRLILALLFLDFGVMTGAGLPEIEQSINNTLTMCFICITGIVSIILGFILLPQK